MRTTREQFATNRHRETLPPQLDGANRQLAPFVGGHVVNDLAGTIWQICIRNETRRHPLRPVIIDESDGELSTFPEALKLGYAGVSTKNCTGFYKSILNAARVAKLGPGYFMSAEDLTTQPGVSVQQDLALVSLLGLTHVERNAHHFIDGMSSAPDAEQNAFVAAHPDLYDRQPGKPARLKVSNGTLALGSLGCPGFAVGVDLDFAALRLMPAAPGERLVPAHPGGRK